MVLTNDTGNFTGKWWLKKGYCEFSLTEKAFQLELYQNIKIRTHMNGVENPKKPEFQSQTLITPN